MKKDYNENGSVQNKYNEWVPAIPEPWHGWGWTCLAHSDGKPCKKRSKTHRDYQAHYALVHILGL